MNSLELIALKLRSKDVQTLSYVYPSLNSDGFWFRKFYAGYGSKLEKDDGYMLEYLVMEGHELPTLHRYLLKNNYNNVFKRLTNEVVNKDPLLIMASQYGNLEIVKYLVEKGANIHTEDDYKLRLAAHWGHLEVIKYLVEKGADIHAENDAALRWAAQSGHLEVVKYLVEQGADIHAKNDEALRYAAIDGHLEVIKYLVEKGADIHADNDYVLRVAATKGHLEVVKYLVEKGADIHARNDEALRYAAIDGHLEVIKYLVEQEADTGYLNPRHKKMHDYVMSLEGSKSNKSVSDKKRCAAKTLKGEQCKKTATVGQYCSIHSKGK